MMEGATGFGNHGEWQQLNRNLLETGFDSDVTILARYGVEVPCHQRFLIESPVLKVMLEELEPLEGVPEVPDPTMGAATAGGLCMPLPLGMLKKIFRMENRGAAEVKEFLSFLYCQETPLALEKGSLAIAMYEMGEEYQVPGLQPLMAAVLEGMPLEAFEKKDAVKLFEIASGIGDGVGGPGPNELEEKAVQIAELAPVSRSRSTHGGGTNSDSSSEWFDRWPTHGRHAVAMGRFDYNSGGGRSSHPDNWSGTPTTAPSGAGGVLSGNEMMVRGGENALPGPNPNGAGHGNSDHDEKKNRKGGE